MGSVSHKLKLASRKLSPRHVSRQLRTARIVRNFVESLGLVYFGTVTSVRSGHADIKGLTLSNTRFDRHLSVGSFKAYDMALAVRRDSTTLSGGGVYDFAWTILNLKLHSKNDLAPLAIIDSDMLQVYNSKFLGLQPMPPLKNSVTSQQFTARFSVFGNIARRGEMYGFLDEQTMANFLFQTQRFSVELVGDELFLYIQAKFPAKKELTWLVNFSVWLAQSVDSKNS